MLITSFYVYVFVALFFLVFAFIIYPQPNSEIFFGIATVLFFILAFAGTAVETLEPQYNSTTGAYEVKPQLHIDYSLMGINLMFAAISMLFFFIDVLEKYKNPVKGNEG